MTGAVRGGATDGGDVGARWAPGAWVGSHQLVARLGAGGAGEVWRAHDPTGRGDVAIKRLLARAARDPRADDRLRAEAERAGRLDSPHVVPVYGTGVLDGSVYVVMRLVPDGDLAGLLATRPSGLGAAEATRIVTQLAHALDSAHGRGLVHRDVTPANVLIEHTPAGVVVQLGDFGLAAAIGTAAAAGGTGAYLAPEGAGDGAVGAAADVYGLGCVLVELLTGGRPFPGPDTAGYRYQHEFEVPRLPGATSPDLAVFDPVVARALAKRPEDRFPTAGALAGAAAAAATRVDDRPSAARRATRWWRRRTARIRVLVVAAVVGTALVVAGTGWFAPDVLFGPPEASDFRACVVAHGVTVASQPTSAMATDQGPGFIVGTPPDAVTVGFYLTRSAAVEQAGDDRRFVAPLGPGFDVDVVARRVVLASGPHSDQQMIATVRGCL